MTKLLLIDSTSGLKALLSQDFILLILGTVLISAGGYIINDYYDIKIDVVNKPEKVQIDRSITRKSALLIHLAITFFVIVCGLFISWKILAVFIFAMSLLWFYSNQLKRLPLVGNITIGFLTALVLVIVEIHYQSGNYKLYLFAFFAFFSTIIREIIKDMEDIKGDKIHGCNTLPIAIGILKTKTVIYLIIVIFSLSALFILRIVDLYLFIFFVGVIMPYYSWLAYKLYRADTTKSFQQLTKYSKLIMLIGLLGMFL